MHSLGVVQFPSLQVNERQKLGRFVALPVDLTLCTKLLLTHLNNLLCSCTIKTSSLTKMNEAKQLLFSSCWLLENILPSQAVLKQHILRAAHQEGFVWGQCLEKDQILLAGAVETKGQSNPSCRLVRKVSQGHDFQCTQHWTTLQILAMNQITAPAHKVAEVDATA